MEKTNDWERYIKDLHHASEPLFIRVKGLYDPNLEGLFGCCLSFEGGIRIYEFLSVASYSERTCQPIHTSYEPEITFSSKN